MTLRELAHELDIPLTTTEPLPDDSELPPGMDRANAPLRSRTIAELWGDVKTKMVST